MKIQSTLQRSLKGLFITGVAVFALASAHAEDLVKVTADNYVRAESDVQMKGYAEAMDAFGKFAVNRKHYDVDNQVTVRGNRDTWRLNPLKQPQQSYSLLFLVSWSHCPTPRSPFYG